MVHCKLLCYITYVGNQKYFESQFFKKLEKSHFRSILVPFGLKTSKQDFSQQYHLAQLNVAVTRFA